MSKIKRDNSWLLVVALFSASHSIADELGLEVGIGVNPNNLAKIATTSMPYAVARKGIRESGDSDIEGFLETDDENVYSLSGSEKIHVSNVPTRQYLGGWPLNTYSDLTIMAGEIPQAADVLQNEGAYPSRYWKVTDPSEPKTGKDVIHREGHIKPAKTHGCLDLHPLRYGDINGNGQPELIVTKDANIYISSPTKKSVIFVANWFMNDDIRINNDPGTVIPELTAEERAELPENIPQYSAYSNLLKYIEEEDRPAWRSFAKLYFGDFDNDEVHDILMWRKLYESRLVSDPIKGFYIKGELLVHYKLVDGEYKLQPTESDKVKSWLSANELTWQKGYPSKSECSGEEGELIPEMHDPLLNDPEVLQ